jgi:hypothetical protein
MSNIVVVSDWDHYFYLFLMISKQLVEE